jgi:hypothetical protein
VRPARRLAHRVIEGLAFVVDPRAKALHSFNETGSRLWSLAASGASLGEAARALTEEFNVDEAAARADAGAFFEKLRSMGLLEGTS